ncbi:MAG: hypothetical protein AAB723_01405 [Patescibacteria group bacterium]
MRKNVLGFTLIEVLFTLSFLFLGLLAVLQVFPTAFNLERSNQSRSQAILLGQEKMEQLYDQSYITITPGNVLEESLPDPFSSFSRRAIVTLVDDNLLPANSDLGLKRIEIIVAWPSLLPWMPKQIQINSLMVAK